MKQSGQSIQNANLGTFLDSATNAIDKGQQQFFTPRSLAAALTVPLAGAHTWSFDPNCGSGHLLTSSGTTDRYGLDIDHRCTTRPKTDEKGVHYHLAQADITKWYPIASEVDFRADLITLNPPFSLRWHADRLAPLAASRWPNVRLAFDAWKSNGTIDSTLASLLIALDLLSDAGEGYLICNHDTLVRFLGHPSGDALSPVRHHVWAWLEIPTVTFEGQHSSFPVAVLYFSGTHGSRNNGDAPIHLIAPSGEPDTVRNVLSQAKSFRRLAFRGRSLDAAYLSSHDAQADKWPAILTEYAHRHLDKPRDLNLWLDEDGRIRSQLDTFSTHKLDMSVVEQLNALNHKRPEQLVVQQASRVALMSAINGGTWSVCPKLVAAIDAAVSSYNSVRAPFYTPNPVMALGWIDEVDHIEARTSRLPGITEGAKYKLRTFTEQIAYPGEKTNLAGEKEFLTLRSQELVIEITGDSKNIHQYHVNRLKNALRPPNADGVEVETKNDGIRIYHHTIASFNDHFVTPIPDDVTKANPELYQRNQAILRHLERRICDRLTESAA